MQKIRIAFIHSPTLRNKESDIEKTIEYKYKGKQRSKNEKKAGWKNNNLINTSKDTNKRKNAKFSYDKFSRMLIKDEEGKRHESDMFNIASAVNKEGGRKEGHVRAVNITKITRALKDRSKYKLTRRKQQYKEKHFIN